MHTAYKHLDQKLRIADLTVGQWTAILLGAAVGIVWGAYLSPLGTSLTLMTAVYVGGLPAAAALVVGMAEFDPWIVVRSALRWRRLDGRYVSGPGASAKGYVVARGAEDEEGRSDRPRVRELELAALWEERS